MTYHDIWQKTLGPGEKVEFEFSVGDRYRKFGLIMWSIISLPLLFAAGFGLLVFFGAFIYYRYYLPMANAYAFTDKRVLIHRGWLSTQAISVDYAKITDIRVAEPFFDRILTHTGNLAINTAGTASHEIVLRHVESPYEVKKRLDALKDALG